MHRDSILILIRPDPMVLWCCSGGVWAWRFGLLFTITSVARSFPDFVRWCVCSVPTQLVGQCHIVFVKPSTLPGSFQQALTCSLSPSSFATELMEKISIKTTLLPMC